MQDLVLDCSVGETVVVTASRDTTVKVWSLSGELLHSLRGHTGPVTGVRTLGEEMVVSASQDCHLKIWNLESGHCIK